MKENILVLLRCPKCKAQGSVSWISGERDVARRITPGFIYVAAQRGQPSRFECAACKCEALEH